MKTISLKKVSAVAVASLGFGLLSVVPANAATVTVAYTYTATTGGVNSKAGATPGLVGSAVTVTPTATITGTTVTSVTPLVTTFKVRDPNGTDLTSGVLCTAGADVAGEITSISVAAGTCVFTSSVAFKAAPAGALGTIVFTPTMGGTYTIRASSTNGIGANNDITAVTEAAAAGEIFVAGAGVTIGSSGKGTAAGGGVTGGIAKALFAMKAHTNPTTYNLTSSGVGTIQTVVDGTGGGLATVCDVAVPGIAGASDYTQGAAVTCADTTFATAEATVASTVAGVQTLTWTAISATTGAPTVVSTLTITWGAAVVTGTVSATNSKSILSTDLLTPFVGTADETISVINTANARAATIQVILNDTQSTPAAIASKAITATISGSGLLGGSTGTGTTLAYTDATVTGTVGRSITVNTDSLGQAFFGVFADGSSGTGTITITQGTTTIATETVTFYGAVASFKATVKKNVVASGSATTAALDVVAYDANSVVVPSVGITVTSGTTATIGSFTETTSSASEAKAGTAVVDVTGVSGKFGSVVLTIKDTSTGLISTTATVIVGALEAATVSAAFDKTSYTPGQLVTLTITAKDANATDVGDSATAGALLITTNASVQGTMPTETAFKLGKQVITFYAPSVTVPLSANIKLVSGAAWSTALDDTTITATASVIDANQTSLLTQIDALNAKIVALNALIAKIMKKLGVK